MNNILVIHKFHKVNLGLKFGNKITRLVIIFLFLAALYEQLYGSHFVITPHVCF